MSQIKRLMPGRVIQTYKRKGLKAKRGLFTDYVYDSQGNCQVTCGCVVGVCFIKKSELNQECSTHIPGSIELESRAEKAGYNDRYISGIEYGFDGNGMPDHPSPEFTQGYKDGQKIWSLVVKHNLVS